MLEVYAFAISAAALVLTLAPFALGQGGQLSPANSIDSIEQLKARKQLILERIVAGEAAHADEHLSDDEWNKRRHFLVTRYIDTVARMDFLNGLKHQEKGE